MKKSAVSSKPQQKRKATPASWQPGESGNPRGAPKRGESWAEVIKRIADMTPKEAADFCKGVAAQLATLGEAVTLKEAVILRVFAALMFEPTAGLFNALLDRTEGKVTQPLAVDMTVRDWRELARAHGLSEEEVIVEAERIVNESRDESGDSESY